MAKPRADLELRPATVGDAALVADLDTARTPDDPSDGAMIAASWAHQTEGERWIRLIAESEGTATAFIGAGHGKWEPDGRRFGWIRIAVHPRIWSEDLFQDSVAKAEAWLRQEGAEVSIARVREDREAELRLLSVLGYREERRENVSQLDLVRGRDRLLANAETTRERMKRQGVSLMTLDKDHDPGALKKLYALDLETTEDVPQTAPWPVPTFAEWLEMWFQNPGIRTDRFWIARDGEAVVGFSVIGYPPQRGLPFTSFTATARSVRGRGIARALKYETIAQAIALGVERVKTYNDGENAPILHLNEEMGYEPAKTEIHLHRDLA